MKPFRLAVLLALAWVGSLSSARADVLIITQPESLIDVVTNEKAAFRVEATGADPLFYQWRRNGVDIPGATGDQLIFDKVAPTDCGTITVTVSDHKDSSTISTKARFTPKINLALGNDDYKNRFNLTPAGGQGYVRSFSTILTDKEPGEPDHAGEPGGRSVWYKWVAPSSGIATFSSRGSGFDTVLAVYKVPREGSLTPISSTSGDDDSGGFLTSQVTINAQEGEEYAIAIDGFDGAYGDIVLHWGFLQVAFLLPSVTQIPADVMVLPPGGGTELFASFKDGSGKWYRGGQPVGDGGRLVLRDLKDEDVGRYFLEVQGEDPRAIVQARSTDVQLKITDDTSNPGTLAAFDKFLRSSRDNRDAKGAVGPGKGGSTAGAGTSRGYTTTQIFSTVGSTKDEDEPNHCGVVGGASEWFSYKAPVAGEMYVNTDGTSFNSVVAVYTGSGFDYASLSSVACNNASGSGKDRVHFTCIANKTYYIAVDGVGGATGTVKLNVYVGDAPAFTAQPTAATVMSGTNLTLSCAVTGSTNFNYQWRRNGTNIAGATASTYTLNNVQATNGGNYTVYVSNLVNAVTSSNALLTIATAPALVTQPTARAVNVGQSSAFSVSATGTDPLFYFWRFNGTNIAGATTTGYTVNSAQLTNAGNYSVVVSNAAGTATSSNALLTVNFAPILLSQPVSQTVKTNTSVMLAVTASAAPAPTYQWSWNGTNLAAATNSSYTIASFLTNHQGDYSVLVSNSQGTARSTNATLYANAPVRVGSFGRGTNGQFELLLIGAAGSNYVLQASSNLVAWTPLVTNTATTGLLYLRDTNSSGFSNRFYRLISVP